MIALKGSTCARALRISPVLFALACHEPTTATPSLSSPTAPLASQSNKRSMERADSIARGISLALADGELRRQLRDDLRDVRSNGMRYHCGHT